MFKQKLARKWGHAIARGWATLLLDRLRDFVVASSSGGGNSTLLRDSQGADELATLDRYHHFHGELELIQTQMAQKPMLRAEVHAHAMRASQNRKKEVRREKEV